MKEFLMIGIIFDCDGTLVDSEHTHFLSWQHALAKRGAHLSEREYEGYVGKSCASAAQSMHEKVGVDSAEAIVEDKQKSFHELQRKGISPIERTVRFVRALAQEKKRLGLKMGVASAARKEEILFHLKQQDLLSVFDVVVSGKDDLSEYSDPEGVNKPKPYIYLHAVKLLGLDPSKCAAFEDSESGVISASTAGLITFAVPNAYTKRHDFSRASFILEPSREITVPEFLKMTRFL